MEPAAEPPTAIKRAELFKSNIELWKARNALRAASTGATVDPKIAELFGSIRKICEAINAAETMRIEFRSAGSECYLRTNRVSVTVSLKTPRGEFELLVRQYDGKLAFVGERVSFPEPRAIEESTFFPTLNVDREFGWAGEREGSNFSSNETLANEVVRQLVDLAEKEALGKITRPLRVSAYRS
jgi:hypothetical protein